jgi:hypothetical protein
MDSENGKTTGRRDQWEKGVDEKLDHIMETLDDAFKSEGFCSRSRAKLGNVDTAIKIYGLLIVGIIIAIITQALKK